MKTGTTTEAPGRGQQLGLDRSQGGEERRPQGSGLVNEEEPLRSQVESTGGLEIL